LCGHLHLRIPDILVSILVPDFESPEWGFIFYPIYHDERNPRSLVSMVTRLRVERQRFRYRHVQWRILSLRSRVQTGTGAHPVSSAVGTGWTVKLITHLHLVSRLRILGAVPPLPHTSSCRGTCLCTESLIFALPNKAFIFCSQFMVVITSWYSLLYDLWVWNKAVEQHSFSRVFLSLCLSYITNVHYGHHHVHVVPLSGRWMEFRSLLWPSWWAST